ncbi:immunoglobulin I-set domain protein [Opisthorchis viverrini]|uniref:Immunoglobulin I-set domain protein n=1 Tax=Opisthorchis viverrini TaxID=6198 RepID=A0A1S8WI95_OPIVI|nr:immunoglobulin I-set domain protein [Opisthorchis viverrini]
MVSEELDYHKVSPQVLNCVEEEKPIPSEEPVPTKVQPVKEREEVVEFEETESFAPKFVQPLEERIEVKEGDAAHLICRVEAKPKADVQWLYEDRPLDVTSTVASTVYESTITDDGDISLVILESLHEDQGLYRCEAVNELGTAYTQTQLVVTDGQFFVDPRNQDPSSLFSLLIKLSVTDSGRNTFCRLTENYKAI